MFGQDPAEGDTEAPTCVGFSVGEVRDSVRTAALADIERVKEATLMHELKVNDILKARTTTDGDFRALVVRKVEVPVIAVIIHGLPAMSPRDIPTAQAAWLAYFQRKLSVGRVHATPASGSTLRNHAPGTSSAAS